VTHNVAVDELGAVDQDEQARLDVLRSYGVLDTAPEEAFEDLTALAADLCGTPMSLISLVDADRQWFKSRRGLDLEQTAREQSFCAHALTSSDLLVVPDALADHRFATNLLVTGDPHLRFYAGAPLVTDEGAVLGTLCVLDTVPRELTARQTERLAGLARQVVRMLDLRRQAGELATEVAARRTAELELRASEQRFRTVFEDSPVGIGLSDETGHWVQANVALATMLGVQPQDLVGRRPQDFVHLEDAHLLADGRRGRAEGGDGVPRPDLRILRADGEVRWVSTSVAAVPGPDGQSWTLRISRDITDRKADEDDLLARERDLAAIAEVARCAQSGEDPRELITRTVRTSSGSSTVSLIEPLDADTLVVTASAGVDAVGCQVPRDPGSLIAQAMATGEAVFLSDVALSPLANPALLALDPTVSALWQPVVVGADVLAVILVTWRQRVEALPDRAARMVAMMADEAALSLRAARVRADLEHAAATDPLTGALNRRAFDRAMTATVGAAPSGPVTLALIDLDRFKVYNDEHGHPQGDVLLRTFTDEVRSALRRDDVFARWGGEEFIVALPSCPPEQVEVILQRLRASVPAGQTCSIGCTTWLPDEPLADAVTRADEALYAAKDAGRDRVVRR
jgi:diguanylate cyclase (GGDEF)-like protein/PAS domain S-box-containing protein